MYEQQQQVSNYMSARGRTIRYRPATGVPAAERFQQVELLVDAVWHVATCLGVDLGRKPTVIFTGKPMAPHPTILGASTRLFIESLASLKMVGLSDAITSAVLKITTQPVNAGHPNLQTIVDETYTDEEEDHILQS